MAEPNSVDLDWLITPYGDLLHHAVLAPKQLARLEDDGFLSKPRQTLDCGRRAARFDIPGVFSRLGRDRCVRCCKVNGLPVGVGSPKNSAECRAILGVAS